MSGDRAQRLETIGLGGDGDEVDAIQALERHFAVILDYREASNWRTAGDVFASLLRALPANQRHREGLWPEFAALICDETGADASRVGRDTLLLALPLSEVARRWFARAFGSRA
jgi:hypothetical protein